jgi:hypothetical protein
MLDSEREPDPNQNNRLKPKWTGEAGQGAWAVEIRGYTDHWAGQRFLRDCLIRNLQKFDSFAKEEDKVGKYIIGVGDPVKGKVSHAFVYHVWPVYDPQPNVFSYINQSYIDPIIDGRGAGSPGSEFDTGAMPSAAAPGPDGTTPAAAAPAAIGPPWRPLSNTTVPGAVPGVLPGFVPPDPSLIDPTKKKETGTRRRFEFVVVLLWREHIPTGSGTPEPVLTAPADGAMPSPTPAAPTPPAAKTEDP